MARVLWTRRAPTDETDTDFRVYCRLSVKRALAAVRCERAARVLTTEARQYKPRPVERRVCRLSTNRRCPASGDDNIDRTRGLNPSITTRLRMAVMPPTTGVNSTCMHTRRNGSACLHLENNVEPPLATPHQRASRPRHATTDAPTVGLEPTTTRLRALRSTD